jgi:putative ABC transport system ATP-binding protein
MERSLPAGSDREVPLIRLEEVTKRYRVGKTWARAVDGVSLEIAEGGFMALAGPSGSGKTTLLNLIGCIDHPSSGSVRFRGRVISGLSDNALSRLRLEKLGFIFQDFQLVPVLSAFENVELPLRLQRVARPERVRRVEETLAAVGLEEYRDRRPNQLSGGQQQRVAIARALVTRPALVLADEPTANLDSRTGTEIVRLMREMNEQLGTTLIFSTHDEHIVELAREVIVLKDGKITR